MKEQIQRKIRENLNEGKGHLEDKRKVSHNPDLEPPKDLKVPNDLSKLSDKDIKIWATYLAKKKTLKELRKMQDLVSQQMKMAHDQKNDNAIKSLEVREKTFDMAVDIQQFDD